MSSLLKEYSVEGSVRLNEGLQPLAAGVLCVYRASLAATTFHDADGPSTNEDQFTVQAFPAVVVGGRVVSCTGGVHVVHFFQEKNPGKQRRRFFFASNGLLSRSVFIQMIEYRLNAMLNSKRIYLRIKNENG